MTRSRVVIGMIVAALVTAFMVGVSIAGSAYQATKDTIDQFSCAPSAATVTSDLLLPTTAANISFKQGTDTKKLLIEKTRSGQPIYATAEQIRVATKITQTVYGFDKIEPQYKERAAIIALITAYVESTWHDIKTLNPDGSTSTGAFQQRSFWGTYEQRTDLAWSTIAFLQGGTGGTKNAGLLDTRNWKTRPMGEVAQDVQVSAYPDRYATRIALAKRFLAMTNVSVSNDTSGTFDDPSMDDQSLGSSGCNNPCVTGFTNPGDLSIATWNGLYTNSHANLTAGARALAQKTSLLGMQEMGSKANREAVMRGLGPGFEQSDGNNAVPIFWRASVFDVVEQGSELLFGKERVENGASGTSLGPRSMTWVTLRVKATGHVFTLVNLHIVPTIDRGGKPNGKDKRLDLYDIQMAKLLAKTAQLKKSGPVYVTGDFNIDAQSDKKSGSSRFAYSRMGSAGFISNWDALKQSGGSAGSRAIDYVWFLNDPTLYPVGQVVMPKSGSDHRGVVVTFAGSKENEKTDDKGTFDPASLQNQNQSNQDGESQGGDQSADGCSNSDSNLSAVLKAAYAQNGKRYVLADGNPNNNTFDCSELVQFAYKAGGVNLPRVASAQYAATKKYSVSKGELQKGDLLFFSDHNGGSNVEHVGFYWGKDPTTGDDLMYHAANPSKPIGVYSMQDDGYWPKFIGATRPIQKSSNVDSSLPSVSGKWLKPSWGITSSYGMRMHPVKHIYKLHDGTDYGAPCGASIRAINYGEVVKIYDQPGGGGHIVEISHGRYHSLYEHLSSDSVSVGDHINRGQIIAKAGATGSASGCHLHLTIKDTNKPDKGWGTQTINPVTFFKMMRQEDFSIAA